MLSQAPDFHIEGTTAAMLRVSGLETRYTTAELGIMEPLGHQAAQAAGTLGRVKMFGSMQRVAREGRVALASDDKNGAQTLHLGFADELKEPDPRHFNAGAMQVETALDFDLTAHETLGRAAIESGDLRWRL